MLSVGLLTLLTITAIASPVERQLFAPTVRTTNGTVVGATSGLVDSFLGVPFAEPPVGNLRLRPPQPVKTNWGSIPVTATPRACPQFIARINTGDKPSEFAGAIATNPATQAALNIGEDCLTLDIYRPSGVPTNAKLPVVFWIYGGGFEFGWTGQYDFTQWIQQSTMLGKPIIAVAVNYRLAGFGFLAGSDLAKEHSTNLGLRDQRLGLQWIADNVAAFGGDPDKVTLWGESAGAISTFDHTVINNGDNTYNGRPLFRAAIMHSGSVIPANNVTTGKSQAVYDQVVQAAGCSGAHDRVECLRNLDYESFLTAQSTVPNIFGPSTLDLSYWPRPDSGDDFFPASPDLQLLHGRFAKVPTIIGDTVDEGTIWSYFANNNLTTNNDLIDYISTYFRDNGPAGREAVIGLTALYPNRPAEGQPDGSPFGTGSNYNTYPQQKRLSAILGDIIFTITRRIYIDRLVRSDVKTYSYMASFLSGSNQLPFVGTFHASDLLVLFNDLLQFSTQRASFQNYYISFINDLEPNGIPSSPPQIAWPQYSSSSRDIIDIGPETTTPSKDTFRQNVANYLLDHLYDLYI